MLPNVFLREWLGLVRGVLKGPGLGESWEVGGNRGPNSAV